MQPRISTDRLFSKAFPNKSDRREVRKRYRRSSHIDKTTFRKETKRLLRL